jgi:Tol biopolymer transport system component
LVFLTLWIPWLAGAPAWAQDPAFGKNKVIWKSFDWSYISTRHYDIYFYGDNYRLAKFSAEVLEDATPQIEKELNYKLRSKVPILVYDSHNDFQQTNVGGGLIPEGVGGFTESFKNRVVLPFGGSYEDFRHVLHHELTHAFTFDMLYGGGLGSFISPGTLFQLPLWFAEGYAEYSSRHGMDAYGDMVLRDAVINNYLIPLEYAGGFLVYKEGQSALQYIADQFGEEKISELLARSRTHLSMDKGMKASLGLSMRDFNREWSRALKREYWPEIARRLNPKELGKPLTRHDEQGSHFNEKPAFSPRGDRVAIFSDKSDFTEVYVISAVDGKFLKRLVKGERSGDLESLHSYVSGLSWSPDGEQIALVGKSKGKDALIIVDAESGKVQLRKHLGVTSLLNPAWGPTDQIAYMGMVDGQADLFIFDLRTETTRRLTRDLYDDNEPTWSPDGRFIVFASDRPTEGRLIDDVSEFDYGRYHLFTLDVETGGITALTKNHGSDRGPTYSPDGERIAYISDRNGIANIYVLNLETREDVAVTDILTGALSASWSPDGDKMVFAAFDNGGFDIFLMEEIQPRGENGRLALTPLAERRRQEAEALLKRSDLQAALPDTAMHAVAGSRASHEDTAAKVDTASAAVDSMAVAEAVPAADTAAQTLTPRRSNGHFGSLRFRSDEPAPDSSRADLSKTPLTRDSALILDPEKDSMLVAQRVEEAKRDGQKDNGEYEVKDYKTRFSPDVVSGTLGYSSFYGLQGQSFLLVSDYMNNHQFFLATDVINTFDDANVLLFYNNATKRMQFGIGVFHTKYFYVDNDERLIGFNVNDEPVTQTGRLFSDRFYGAVAQVRYPLSLFTRLELNLSHVYIDREYYDRSVNGTFDDQSTQASVASLAWIRDNTLWGLTGPTNGGRSNVSVEYAADVNDRSISYTAFNADFRRYLKLGGGFSLASRLAGGSSGGSRPKAFYLGGVPNWIGSNLDRPSEIYTVRSLYFSQSSFPLRGYDFYEVAGTHYAIANFELRYPFIDYLAMRFPLGLTLSRVQGAIFIDAGMAWGDRFPDESPSPSDTALLARRARDAKLVMTSTDPSFRLEDLKLGYGFGLRANLGFLVFRWDVAWPTDLNLWSQRARHYVSLGADF